MGKSYRNRYHYGSKFIDNNGICVYCGCRANTLDHFVPLAVLYMMGDIGGGERVTLESCSECNTIAGSHVFKTVGEKRDYIHKNLEEKYHVLLKAPNWTKQELSRMGYNMRTYIESHLVYRDWIDERLTWQNVENPASAEIAKVRSKLGVHGKNTARYRAQTNQPEKDSS
jgi:hypothetical protein